MEPELIVLIAVVIALAALMAWLYIRKRTTENLRQKFGPEYDRAVLEQGSKRKAEAILAERERRIETFHIRNLDRMEQERFAKEWEAVQSHFIDSPKGAVTEADELVSTVMKTRGYPMSDFDQRAADISVDHPQVVENYRTAHKIALRADKDQASTEDLRVAMIHCRSLFGELVRTPATMEAKREGHDG